VSVPDEHIRLLAAYYKPEVERLRALVPGIDLTLWPHFAGSAWRGDGARRSAQADSASG
jgi:hypothetical protein